MVDENTAAAIESMSAKVEDAIGVVAEKIGEGADYFWPHLVEAEFAKALGPVIGVALLMVVSLTVAIVCFFNYRRAMKEDKAGIEELEFFLVPTVVSSFIFGLCVIISALSLGHILPGLLAPEAEALKTILEAVK